MSSKRLTTALVLALVALLVVLYLTVEVKTYHLEPYTRCPTEEVLQ